MEASKWLILRDHIKILLSFQNQMVLEQLDVLCRAGWIQWPRRLSQLPLAGFPWLLLLEPQPNSEKPVALQDGNKIAKIVHQESFLSFCHNPKYAGDESSHPTLSQKAKARKDGPPSTVEKDGKERRKGGPPALSW